jgi:molecular chaperone DnaJ
MAQRLALIISSGSDSKLSRLAAPEVDDRALEAMLKDPQIGFFDGITTLMDRSDSEVRIAIDQFFRNKGHDDTFLLYFSGRHPESLQLVWRDQPYDFFGRGFLAG